MIGALLALLLAPFAGAALDFALRRRGLQGVWTALLALAAALGLALYLLVRVGDGPPLLLTAAWVPMLDLGLSVRGDRLGVAAAVACLLLALACVWRLRAGARPERAALVLGCTGIAQALMLSVSLPLLAGGAAVAAIVAFALDGQPTPQAFDRAQWVLLVRIAGALALLAAALLLTDLTGSGVLETIAAAAPAAQPLFGLATALLWLGVLSFAGAWPFSRWLWRGQRGAALADPILAAVGVALALRFAPLLPESIPRLAIAPALLAAPLLVTAVGRVLDGARPLAPTGPRRA
jgi:multicomponent Na+:H+ antiporter subunit A